MAATNRVKIFQSNDYPRVAAVRFSGKEGMISVFLPGIDDSLLFPVKGWDTNGDLYATMLIPRLSALSSEELCSVSKKVEAQREKVLIGSFYYMTQAQGMSSSNPLTRIRFQFQDQLESFPPLKKLLEQDLKAIDHFFDEKEQWLKDYGEGKALSPQAIDLWKTTDPQRLDLLTHLFISNLKSPPVNSLAYAYKSGSIPQFIIQERLFPPPLFADREQARIEVKKLFLCEATKLFNMESAFKQGGPFAAKTLDQQIEALQSCVAMKQELLWSKIPK